jgi:hypothetical protein
MSTVVFEIRNAHMSNQYPLGICKPDMYHIIHNIFIPDESVAMQPVQALFNWGGISIFMTLRPQIQLGLADEPEYVMTLDLNGQLTAHLSDSAKPAFVVQTIEDLTPGQPSEVIFGAM